jgi:hypothetical protein
MTSRVQIPRYILSTSTSFFSVEDDDKWILLKYEARMIRKSDETQGSLKGNSAGDPRVGQIIN